MAGDNYFPCLDGVRPSNGLSPSRRIERSLNLLLLQCSAHLPTALATIRQTESNTESEGGLVKDTHVNKTDRQTEEHFRGGA